MASGAAAAVTLAPVRRLPATHSPMRSEAASPTTASFSWACVSSDWRASSVATVPSTPALASTATTPVTVMRLTRLDGEVTAGIHGRAFGWRTAAARTDVSVGIS